MVANDKNAPLVLVEKLRLNASFEEFTAAMGSFAQRVEREGIRGFTFMQHCGCTDSDEVCAVLAFSDPPALLEHLRMIETWSEFRAMAATVEVAEICVLGQVPEGAARWAGQFTSIQPTQYPVHIAGFTRGS